ncbi:cupin domain-containing protein [Colwellia sp. TT2012]|uniref:cupin domain-containing protein n=1 Tax=Colwellia sp. TT2012 TaxID=1720342 RepID=UPI00070C4230|nr:cupin domain-containing protein [Colwellia sp. TT2012]
MIRKIFLIPVLAMFLFGCETLHVSDRTLPPDGLLVATYFTATEIDEFIEALPQDTVSDRKIRVVEVVDENGVGLYGVYRPKDVLGKANLHHISTTETYYILKGHGTLVTGGTIPDGVLASPNYITIKGTYIEGGVSRKIGPGDVIIIPGYTAHWWSEVDENLSYISFRTGPYNEIEIH